jgi:hypothetical protein
MKALVSQSPAAGKLNDRRSPRASCAAKITIPLIALLAILSFDSSPALAEGTPGWQISTFANPTSFSASDAGRDDYALVVSNVGGAPTNGGTITLTDALPPGMSVGQVEFGLAGDINPEWSCGGAGTALVTCTSSATVGVMGQLAPITVKVNVSGAVPVNSELSNSVAVAGGGAPVASATQTTKVNSSAPVSFAATELTNFLSNLGGAPDTQAADHPNGLTTSFGVTSVFNEAIVNEKTVPAQDWKDVVVDLPPGVVGNPQVAAQCPLSRLTAVQSGGGYLPDVSGCPVASQVATLGIDSRGAVGGGGDGIPIFNMVPERNTPAEFAFTYVTLPIGIYPTVVGQGAAAHIRVTTPGIPGAALQGVVDTYVKFFGDPAAHDGLGAPNAFFTNSSDCDGGPLVTTLHVDSYENPGSWSADSSSTEGTPNFTDGAPDFSDPAWKSTTYASPPVTGCEKLHFDPSLALQPDTTQADEPTGLAVDLSVPQNPDPHGLTTPPIKDVTVTLPAGVSLSPSAGDGLQACTSEQFDLESNTLGSCPNASVLGTVKVSTPLLAEPMTGYVFLAEPGCDPCSNQDAADGNMIKLYIQVEGSGIVQKVAGAVYANTATGQLTSKFPNLPQFPVSDEQVQFKGGLRAGLATPQACGTFAGSSDLTPWSAPFTPDATPSSSFNVDWDGHGGACPAGGLPLTPSFSAGTSNPNAGQFSPFTLTFAREDRQQDLSGIQVRMPPGLLGSLAGVPLCAEGPANAGTCPQASRIGTMTVAAGPGGHPFYTQGSIYITEHYDGAPFGLSIVVPTRAGPFNLGNVVVRSRINIDQNTTALTVTSDPFPQVIDGIPIRLRTANVTIERPGFIFNPTNCAQQQISASIAGAQGTTANVSAPFAVSGCAGLHFGPKFSVSTSGKTSKADGASLDARVTYPSGAQSNIARVKVDLPKQLPSRLTTLQKACTSAQFESNPAGCPVASAIGIAKAVTPVLPVPLTGPVYFVSHGGEAFPSLIIVLQGYGVRVDLTAATFISKQGITSSTFKTVPDDPVSSFEIYLPEGRYSALAANGNLCTSNLQMPTSFIAQDGAQFKQNTKIPVTGCPKAKKAIKKKAKKASRDRRTSS